MDKDQAALKQIRDALANKGSELRTLQLGEENKTVTVHVKGMSEDTSKEELKEALEAYIGRWQDPNRIKEMRPFTGNTLAATVILTKQAADSILQEETVKVGIVRCQVEKRIRVPRCNRCWAFDHARDVCAGPDRTGTCYGCGVTGHDTESCRAAARCVLCDEAQVWQYGLS
ncbi:uncharacterized protein LOC126878594 [Diabrotica virgifera virgifera]|uniref:CCHC-type domain-containing protein n=1 Tax=Diabrotica virgifera virgifera TaxID=50390 RepID=A0ABM5JHE4_DIAVI|nr:uncharacterized protein LOC126878594 [Diabrotica virgifera virgifera]